MGRDHSRKGPRRTRTDELRDEVDDDLIELAAVISEYKLDNNASGWFSLPWKSGWNVVRLMVDTHEHWLNGFNYKDAPWGPSAAKTVSLLRTWIGTGEATRDIYWRADELRTELAGQTRALACALRCLTILISKSDGGGHVYNDVVRPCYEALDPSSYSGIVLDARCRDAIGVQAGLQNDRHDRQRRAFTTAWQRGLYNAAYAIPPVKR